MLKGETGRNLIYIVAVLMTGLILLSIRSGESAITLLFYAMLPIGLWKPEFVVPTYFITSLSSNYFAAEEGLGFNRLLAFIIIAGVFLRLCIRRRQMLKKWVGNCIFIMFTTFISFVLSNDSLEFSVLYVLGLNILVFVAVANLSLRGDELAQLFGATMFAVLLTSLFFLHSIINDPQIITYGRLTIEEGINENRFGMMMAQLSAYCFGYVVLARRMIDRVACLMLGLTNAYLVLLSGSRSSLVGIIFGLLACTILSSFMQKKIKRIVYFSVIIAFFIFIFGILIDSNSLIAERMTLDQIISSGGTGRWPRIMAELEYVIPNNLFFGVGISSVNETIALSQYMGNPGSSHNFIFSSLTQIGIVGFIIYMIFFVGIIRQACFQLQNKEILIVPLMLMLTAIGNGVGEIIYTERLFWNTLSLAALCIVTNSNSKISEHSIA